MTRGVRLYLVGSVVLVSLAGCGRGFFQAEREPWRAEAEIACLKSGAVKESLDVVRVEPISGPGMCGAQYPLKVAALGDSTNAFGFADDLRPPAPIGNQPRWPVAQPQTAAPAYPPQQNYPQQQAYPQQPYPSAAPQPYPNSYSNNALRQPSYGAPSNGPISLAPPGVAQQDDDVDLPAESAPDMRQPSRAPYAGSSSFPQR